ncbi:MAG: hypothetical protein ACOX6P_11535 [Candidatus Merdivicinus sp.]|jgi:hypothetical protein
MVYIETKNEVVFYIHYYPLNEKMGLGKTEEELRKTGYLVDNIPEYGEEVPEGKQPELHYNGSDFSWVLVDVPEESEQPNDLDQRISDLEVQVAALTRTEE